MLRRDLNALIVQAILGAAVLVGCSTLAGIKDNYHTVGDASAAGGSAGSSGNGGAAGVSGSAGTDAGGGSAGTDAGGGAGADGGGGACNSGQRRCGSTCVDENTDGNNCGACGKKCATGAQCSVGQCECSNGGIVCDGTCVDISSDAKNCGGCGNQCVTGAACGGGSCGLEWANWAMPNPPSTLPNPQSYDTGTTGVVTDNVTQLMWQQAFSATSYDWAGAEAYCANLSLAGHIDWRLPTEIELYSLVDYTKSNPSIDTTAFPNTPATEFWSSSLESGNSSSAWLVVFNYGYAQRANVTNAYRVRCVRLVYVLGSSHYTVASGTVKDNLTGLTWQQPIDANSYSWSQAKSYCAGLTLAGVGGWRLPSVKELMTLLDFGVASPPTIDTTVFPSTPATFFWSSSAGTGLAGYWDVTFGGASTTTTTSAASDLNSVRCVR